MANSTSGKVSIRFSVEDYETVHKALDSMGKDGEAALKRIDAASKTPSTGLKGLTELMSGLKSQVLGLAVPLGPAGQGLIALGPAGLAAAVGLGAVLAIFDKIRDGAKAFGQFAREVRDGAAVSGLGIEQYQAFVETLQKYGVEQERATTFLVRFNLAREAATHGSGELYDALRKQSAALAEDFAAARTAEQALNIFTKALSNANETTRAFLLNAAGGRGAGLLGPAFQAIAGAGGIGAITASAQKLGEVFDKDIIKKQADAAIAAEQKAQLVERSWNSAYAAIYQKWKDLKQSLGLGPDNSITIALVVRNTFEKGRDLSLQPAAEIKAQIAEIDKQIKDTEAGLSNHKPMTGLMSVFDLTPTIQKNLAELKDYREKLNAQLDVRGELGREFARKDAMPAFRDDAENAKLLRDALEREIETEKKRLAVLGDMATAEDKAKLRKDQLRLSILDNIAVTSKEAAAVRGAADAEAEASRLTSRVNLGVASEAEIVRLKVLQQYKDRAKGALESAQEIATAEAIIQREARQTAEALQVRASATPNLTKLSIDAGNLTLQLDEGLTGALRGVTQEFSLLDKSGKSFNDRMKDTALRFADVIWQATLMKTIVGPLSSIFSGGLSSIFGGGGGGGGPIMSPFAGGGIMTAAGPLPIRRYGLGGVANTPQVSIWGEEGKGRPEAMVPLNDGRTIPVTLRGANGGNSNTIVQNINVVGATGNDEVKRMVSSGVQEANSRSAAMLKAYDAHLPDRQRDMQRRGQ